MASNYWRKKTPALKEQVTTYDRKFEAGILLTNHEYQSLIDENLCLKEQVRVRGERMEMLWSYTDLTSSRQIPHDWHSWFTDEGKVRDE